MAGKLETRLKIKEKTKINVYFIKGNLLVIWFGKSFETIRLHRYVRSTIYIYMG